MEEIFEVDHSGFFKGIATFPGLCGCLAVVHVYEGEKALGWHAAGLDLAMKLSKEQREMYLMIKSSAVEASDGRFDDWFDLVKKNPGVTYLCGPNADDVARKFFKVEEENCVRTRKGPVDVEFDLKELKFNVL